MSPSVIMLLSHGPKCVGIVFLEELLGHLGHKRNRSSFKLGRQNRECISAPTGRSCAAALQWIPPPEPTRSSSLLLSSSSSASLDDQPPTPEWRAVQSSSSSSRESSPSFATTGSEVNEEQRATDREVSWPIHDRWLFDADNEPSVGNDGPNEKDRALLNEFHPTYLLKGMSLKKTIIQQLTTDPTIYTPSSDGRLLGFCLIGLASPPRFVATPSLLFRVPLSLRPPSRAAAMHQHQHQQQSAQQGAIGTPQTMGRPFLCSSK
ncbi:hypothetical protein EDB89DRAFT_2080423 [Lactarius sanguifluus]|nr:hypothetical protein EDB89DRAFT_2080423 [Lactarius sanguifluus]